MIERQIDIRTADGLMDTFVCVPDRDGPFPAVLFYMDAPGMREELRDMARRLATVGYHVTLPNLYYRTERGLELDQADMSKDGSATRQRMFDLMGTLTIERIMADTAAMIAVTRSDPSAKAGPMGAVGYCMSGPFVFAAASHFPDDIAAAASIYGVRLCTDAPDSPHLGAAKIKGEMYFACAEQDSWAPLEMIEDLKRHLAKAGTKGEVEIYPSTHHGFAFPKRAMFNKPAAERHWQRLFSLFKRNL
jgi:carboxymethylenebutenolidase